MSDKKRWAIIIGAGALVAAGFTGLIYMESGKIDQLRLEIQGVTTEIENGRKLIAQTPALEKNVIIQRETDSVVAQILPSDEDLNNFVRTLRSFQEKSGARIVDVKNKNVQARDKTEFDRVVYSLKFDANIFQMLAFVAQVENHARFMSVPALKLSAARRRDRGSEDDSDTEPRHQIQMDVETYVYEPKDSAQEVQIDNYERKRDLLLSEISRRQADLHVDAFEYGGQRGRRDPWVDPRVPRPDDGTEFLPIEAQILLVDELVERTREATRLWEAYRDADNLIAQMKTRAELDQALATLTDEVRVVREKNQLVFVSAERRFEKEVVAALDELNSKLNNVEDVVGPTVAVLQEAIDTVDGFLRNHDYDQALRAFYAIEPRLHLAENDVARRPLVSQLRWLAQVAETVIEFDGIPMAISGVALFAGRSPIAVINGEALTEGELVADQLFIRTIREDEIEFVFRDVIVSRRIEP